jgi:hypothetical protein
MGVKLKLGSSSETQPTLTIPPPPSLILWKSGVLIDLVERRKGIKKRGILKLIN